MKRKPALQWKALFLLPAQTLTPKDLVFPHHNTNQASTPGAHTAAAHREAGDSGMCTNGDVLIILEQIIYKMWTEANSYLTTEMMFTGASWELYWEMWDIHSTVKVLQHHSNVYGYTRCAPNSRVGVLPAPRVGSLRRLQAEQFQERGFSEQVWSSALREMQLD